MAYHVHRLARLGPPMLISGNWYKFKCGVTVQPGDGGDMAAVITDCMATPTRAQVMGENGRRMLVTHFSRSCAMAKWDEVLKRYCNCPGSWAMLSGAQPFCEVRRVPAQGFDDVPALLFCG